MMHSLAREYDDSPAAKQIVDRGRAALVPIAACLRLNYAGRPPGTPGSGEGYWRRFATWTFLVNGILAKMGRRPQAPQIHNPEYAPPGQLATRAA